MEISWDDFSKIEIRTGTILEARPFPEAKKPAYQLRIDFGPLTGMKNSSAQITIHYKPEDLVGRSILAVVNFPPKRIAGFVSECLVLGVYDENNDVILIEPGKPVSNGRILG